MTWASEGEPCPLLDFENISKMLFFQFKKQILPLLAPLEKFLEKSPTGPRGKNPSYAHGCSSCIL